jgi:Pentapeptide repeats (8 copies)
MTGVHYAHSPYSFKMTSGSARRQAPRLAALVLAGCGALALICLLLWYGPDLLATHDVAALPPSQRAAQFPAAVDNARGRLLTLGAGLVALAALIYTARSFTLSREGQVTDRFTRAIEQLGAEKLDVRIGGIYALERIARDSSRDHPVVMEVLAAFVRERSHERWEPTRPPDWGGPEPGPRPDVLAAVTVIGRRDVSRDRDQIDLAGANLSRAQLPAIGLARCNLNHSNLTGANMYRANLRQTEFVGADLTRANLSETDLYGADFTFAVLSETLLSRANLSRVIFSGARLDGQPPRGVHRADAQAGPAGPGEVPVPDGWEHDPDTGRLRRTGGPP